MFYFLSKMSACVVQICDYVGLFILLALHHCVNTGFVLLLSDFILFLLYFVLFILCLLSLYSFTVLVNKWKDNGTSFNVDRIFE